MISTVNTGNANEVVMIVVTVVMVVTEVVIIVVIVVVYEVADVIIDDDCTLADVSGSMAAGVECYSAAVPLQPV